MIDLTPATDRMRQLVSSVTDDQLDAPTPCPKANLGDLIDHVGSLTVAFTGSARKDGTARTGPPPPPSAANLGPGWRERISRDLGTLAEAWSDPAAWDGMTKAGGNDLPGQVCGLVVLDELVLHGWDVAVASGQPYDADGGGGRGDDLLRDLVRGAARRHPVRTGRRRARHGAAARPPARPRRPRPELAPSRLTRRRRSLAFRTSSASPHPRRRRGVRSPGRRRGGRRTTAADPPTGR